MKITTTYTIHSGKKSVDLTEEESKLLWASSVIENNHRLYMGIIEKCKAKGISGKVAREAIDEIHGPFIPF